MVLQTVASRIVARQTPDAHLITEERKRKNYAEFWNVIPVTEPYRCVLAEVRDKLYHTRYEACREFMSSPCTYQWLSSFLKGKCVVGVAEKYSTMRWSTPM